MLGMVGKIDVYSCCDLKAKRPKRSDGRCSTTRSGSSSPAEPASMNSANERWAFSRSPVESMARRSAIFLSRSLI